MKHYSELIGIIIGLIIICPLSGNSQGIKGKETRRHTIPIVKYEVRSTNEEGGGSKDEDRRSRDGKYVRSESVLMIGQKPIDQADTEVKAALDFVRDLDGYSLKYSTFLEIRKHPKQLQEATVIWFHRPDSNGFSSDESDPRVIELLHEYLVKGGKILLSLDAFPFTNLLGVESTTPSVRLKASVDEGYGRKLGFHAFREHPLFEGLHGGSYIYKPIRDLTVRVNGFFGDTLPAQGKVVAIDWDYIFFREDSKIITEYDVGQGKLIAIGAYTIFSVPNENRMHLEVFTKNILDYLTGKLDGKPRFFWDYSSPDVIQCPEKIVHRDESFEAIPEADIWEVKADPLAFPIHTATNSYCEAAGEQMLIMALEKGGLEEVWTHPFMALRDFESGIRYPASDSVIWFRHMVPEIEIRPDGFIRHYRLEDGILDEVVVADPTLPRGVIHYSWDGDKPVELLVRFLTNLRLMWPYPASSTGSICYGWDVDYHAFYFTDRSGTFDVMVGGNKVPITHHTMQGDGFIVNANASYSLDAGESLDIVFASGANGIEKTFDVYDRAIRDPQGIFLGARHHVKELLKKCLIVTTPDANFNAGYKWALLGTDRFFVNTPGMGSALVAGYGTTRRGWDGAQKVSGRPGYAWYFGRDGQWSGFALLDYGDFEKVKKNLEFYLKYQDLNGKIFHEATTSGVIHYDASDATPLFIVMAGNYFQHSGDTAFIRTNWLQIKKAIEFCFSTDTDKDHLIENTNVGHGWVEGGKLFGSHSSFYLTGCWVAALEAAGDMAEVMGDNAAIYYKQEEKVVKNLIDQKFWNARERFYAYGINKNGSQRTEPTILAAVPAYFGITDRYKMRYLLDRYASNAFSTNWGTRIISEDSPMFKPTGYHYGSVWPLFTGWTALAEYRYGNYIQGYSHILNNLNIYRNWGLGFVEEVLNGETYQPSGVCPHQCWSETMVLQPVIEGLLGIKVDAPKNTLYFSPQLPVDWDSLTVSHIRIGNHYVNLTFKRDSSTMIWKFSGTDKVPVTANMMLSIPPETAINMVLLNGEEHPFTTFTTSRFLTLQVNFSIVDTTTIEIEFTGGISVLPKVSYPFPGERAEGMRIIDANLKGDRYIIDLEGISGSSDTLSVWSYYPVDGSDKNAKILERNGSVTKYLVDFDATEKKYSRKEIILTPKKE